MFSEDLKTESDITHADSAGKSSIEFDAKAEARLRWKIDLYVIPTVSLLDLFCFIDRANIGEFYAFTLRPQSHGFCRQCSPCWL
jgi:hypothetical protein